MITRTLHRFIPRIRVLDSSLLRILIAGMLFPVGFAPFHLPGVAVISLAFFYHTLLNSSFKKSIYSGFVFGTGLFGTGVSWVIISIHEYGQLNYLLSILITIAFIFYLSLFPALMAAGFHYLRTKSRIHPALLFAVLGMIFEYLRATLFTGFPWLRLGTALIDTPMQHVAPIIGIYGLSFLGGLYATLLVHIFTTKRQKQWIYLAILVLCMLSPLTLKNIQWTHIQREKPVSTAIIQANLSMREKWDEALFEKLMQYYSDAVQSLLGTRLIVMPESALPLPGSYIKEYLDDLSTQAQKKGSAILTGILHAEGNQTLLFNTMQALGSAEGQYAKQHLVPFGEFIPKPFKTINDWLSLPDPGMQPGLAKQIPIALDKHPVASLICYEIAYQELLRKQMQHGQWIVSISDNGWFGHSLASWQQLQMAQMLSLMTGRYQVVSNNDGLSSIIDEKGQIVDSLAPFSAGILQSRIFPAEGRTPWVYYGDSPIIWMGILLLLVAFGQVIGTLRKSPSRSISHSS